jgi:hypothetical protein
LEGGGLAVSNRVVSRRVGSISVASVERGVSVVTGHDKVAAHFVKGVEALQGCGCFVSSGNADSDADLVVGDEVHPLFVEDIGTGNVGSNVSSDRVTHVGGTMGVQFTTFVTSCHTNLGKVTQGHDLQV